VPPTPSAKHLLNQERLGRLRKGALVVAVTRAHAIDMAALRERFYAPRGVAGDVGQHLFVAESAAGAGVLDSEAV